MKKFPWYETPGGTLPFITRTGSASSSHLFLLRVLCFSACSTIFSSTWRPFRFRTAFMYFRAWLSESAFSPKCKYSSSVVGTQKGSLGMIL